MLELFAMPEAEGHLEISMDKANDLVFDKDEFVVALTSSNFEAVEIDIPLCVALVEKKHWKKCK